MYIENSSNGVCYIGLTTTLDGFGRKGGRPFRSAALGRCVPGRSHDLGSCHVGATSLQYCDKPGIPALREPSRIHLRPADSRGSFGRRPEVLRQETRRRRHCMDAARRPLWSVPRTLLCWSLIPRPVLELPPTPTSYYHDPSMVGQWHVMSPSTRMLYKQPERISTLREQSLIRHLIRTVI